MNRRQDEMEAEGKVGYGNLSRFNPALKPKTPSPASLAAARGVWPTRPAIPPLPASPPRASRSSSRSLKLPTNPAELYDDSDVTTMESGYNRNGQDETFGRRWVVGVGEGCDLQSDSRFMDGLLFANYGSDSNARMNMQEGKK